VLHNINSIHSVPFLCLVFKNQTPVTELPFYYFLLSSPKGLVYVYYNLKFGAYENLYIYLKYFFFSFVFTRSVIYCLESDC
jgi:hypothetical protein